MGVTAAQIITDIYNSGELKKVCQNIGGDYWFDLQQEVTLILLEKPTEKIIELQASGFLKWYIVRIIMSQFKSNNSAFHKKYRHFDHNYPTHELLDCYHPIFEETDHEYHKESQRKADALKRAFTALDKSNSFPYEQRLLDLYLQVGKKRKVSEMTGIPYRTVLKNLNDIHAKLRAACL